MIAAIPESEMLIFGPPDAKYTVTVLNIVLGWTLIAWVILFVWAMMAETEAEEPA